jgi:hypothetical protein
MWAAVTLAVPLAYLAAMLLALVLRFGALPNYLVVLDWPGNVARIIRSTPAVSDMLPIVASEWLIEIGRMNYDYGNGISEWGMTVVPAKLAAMLVLGALVATNAVLLQPAERACSRIAARGSGAATGLGAAMVAFTSITMTWVVCCSTPSWIVGLAMLGVGVSTANLLEGFGPWIEGLGFALLGATTLILAAHRARAAGNTHAADFAANRGAS